jgi:hypothetical protein
MITEPEANQQHGEIVSDWVNHSHEKHYLLYGATGRGQMDHWWKQGD